MADTVFFVTKASGEQEAFDLGKLQHSLKRAGAPPSAMHEIEEAVQKMLYPGISTREIYRKAFSLLRKASPHMAARYKLKKAIMELGPSGFPFEKYVGKLLDFEGYDTQVGKIVQGHCVPHEIDVIALKDEQHFMIECKYHSEQNRKCDVKIPLYIHARFLDVEKMWQQRPGHDHKFHQGWIVTNTRFTDAAIQYGNCAGLRLISWNYPRKESLKKRIDRSGLHPLTCLTTLTKKEKQQLLDQGLVLCRELHRDLNQLRSVGVSEARLKKVEQEVRLLCEPESPIL